MNRKELIETWVQSQAGVMSTEEFIAGVKRLDAELPTPEFIPGVLDNVAEISLEAEAVEPLASFLILLEKARDLIGYYESEKPITPYLADLALAFNTVSGLFAEYAKDNPAATQITLNKPLSAKELAERGLF